MTRLFWTLRSRRDLLEIRRFIASDHPDAARKWVERLRKRARAAASAPRAGRHVPEIEREDVREVIVGAYRIVYRVLPGSIHVLTVFEGHRRFPNDAVEPP
jgi:plasmid stabilization system protein ParE